MQRLVTMQILDIIQLCCKFWLDATAGVEFVRSLDPGFPIVRPVRAKVSPGPDVNFRGKQTKDCLGLGQQSHGRKDCRARSLALRTAHPDTIIQT